MEKMRENSAEGVESVSKKREHLLDKLNSIALRNPRKAILLAALSVYSSVDLPGPMQEANHIVQQVRVFDLNKESDQKLYERVNDIDSNLSNRLREEIGMEEVAYIEGLESVTNEEERADYIQSTLTDSPEVSGFSILSETSDGPSDKEVKKLIKALPHIYQTHVTRIKYEDTDRPLPGSYGIKPKKSGKSELEAAHADLSANEIIFTAGSRVDNFAYTLDSVIHEEAHLKDWRSNKAMTWPERMMLAQEVIDRVNSSDRFKSSYVESIKNSDRQVQLAEKADEYYAEITAAYFDQGFLLLPEKDKRIVEEVIHKTDPAFVRGDRNKIARLIGNMAYDHNNQKANAGISEVVMPVRNPITGEVISDPHMGTRATTGKEKVDPNTGWVVEK